MAKKKCTLSTPALDDSKSDVFARIREILESARRNVARSVNTTQVVTNWLIGREIVEEEQDGNMRARYGERLLPELAAKLKSEFGRGYSTRNLEYFRRFYMVYPSLASGPISQTPSAKLKSGAIFPPKAMQLALQSDDNLAWQPGLLSANLSWSHYQKLLHVESDKARSFYEIEAIQNGWAVRELERQINSLLFERLAKSKDKQGVMELATRGQEVMSPLDIFKDPVVIEFVGLPESNRLVESDLETSLIDNLQAFLLELGKGFAFVSRQERITLDGDHFYIDLVFYHTILKCFVLIDLKVGKLTHADLGQLQLYVNYYDEHRLSAGDQPTLGLILCTDKNDAVVKYTLGKEKSKKIFASRYQLHLPSEAELQAELQREVRQLTSGPSPSTKKQRRTKKS